MKKILFFAALVLGLASCSTDPEDLNVVVGGEQDVMLNVSLPEATRANSANGFQIADHSDTYDLRYILEVYRAVDENNIVYEKCQRQVKLADAATMSFPVRLAPGYNYQIVAWADIVGNGSYDDRLYDTSNGLDAIEIISWDAMDETRDAYTGTKYIPNFSSSSSNLSMELTRPFAKVRVVATDIDDITALGLSPEAAKVSYSQKMYTKYNAVTEEASAAADKSHTYTTFPYTDVDGEMTLFADYVFVPESNTAKFTLEVYDDATATRLIKKNSFSTDIFVERNKITTIKGDVLTEGGNVSITVDNGLEEKVTINVVDTAEALMEQLEQLEDPDVDELNIELGGDIDLGDLFGISTLSTRAAATLPIVIPEGKVVALDLNGYKITTPWDDQPAEKHHYAFENHGSLTIQDSSEGKNGEIIARGIFNYGTMTLESGIINACDGNGGYGVRNYEGAEFVMDGGSIVTSYEDGDTPGNGYDACPVRVDEGATATFNGGTINNISNFTCAIDNYGETTINGGTFTTVHTTIANHSTMTIDGGSFTCNGLEGITAHAFWAAAGTATINGGTFNGKDNYNGFNVCASKGATVNIKGGEFLPVHSGSLYGEGTINVMGGEFFDDPSARVVEGYKAVEGNNVWTVVVDPAAKIGETEYNTLEEAFEAGGEITLLRNVTLAETVILAEGQTVVLNLDGKTITGPNVAKDAEGNRIHVIVNNGTLTINGNGTVQSIATNGGSAILNNGTLTLYNATIEGAPSDTATGTASYAVNTQGTNSGLIVNNTSISGRGAIGATNGTKVVLNGGTYHTPAVAWGHAVYADGEGTEVVVNGGTFSEGYEYKKDNWGMYQIYSGNKAKVIVKGGDFSQTWDCANGYDLCTASEGTIEIYGGTFADDPSKQNGKNFVAAGYESVKENDVWTVKKMTEEAKLRKVLAEGGEVTLEEDITIAAKLEVKTTEAIVVNGNNKTINYKGSDRAFDVNGLDTANVTLNDLTFVNTESYCQRGINFNVDGTLTLNNVTVGETGTPATYAINLPGSSDGAEVVITNSYFCGNIALNVWGENAKIKATGSEFVSYDGNEAENYAAISLNNDGSSIANGTTIDIDGGKVIARDEKGEPSYAVRNSTMTGEVTISDSTEVVGTGINPVAAVIYEGYNEFYSCTTLKAAIDKAIETKGSVRLIKDIVVDETITIPAEGNVTIDLNDKTISGTMHKNDGAVIKNLGTLTIKNGTISSTAFNGGSTVNNQGTVTIEDATLNGANGGDGSWPSYPVNNYSVMAVTNTAINGYHGAVACNAAGETTVTNCTFTKNYFQTSSHVFYINHADAKVVVNGGTYSHNGFDGSLAYVNKGEITINDGTFTAKDGGYGIAALTGGKVIVNGGTLPAFLNWGGEIVDNRTK